VRLVWQERGGPPVAAPERRGFGSRLIDRIVGTQLEATVERVFAPEGLRIELMFCPGAPDETASLESLAVEPAQGA
jgi:two-component sensor histidine kinase